MISNNNINNNVLQMPSALLDMVVMNIIYPDGLIESFRCYARLIARLAPCPSSPDWLT